MRSVVLADISSSFRITSLRLLRPFGFLLLCTIVTALPVTPKTGAIYFNGWSDTHHEITINNAVLIKSYPERAPLWSYYSNSVAYMEKEIDAAVNTGGLSFFAFLFYPALDSQPDGNYASNPRNHCFDNYFKAPNRESIEWCLYLSNHPPYQPDEAYWRRVIDYLCEKKYFHDPKYLKVDGRPIIIVFSSTNFTANVRAYLREKIAAEGFPGCFLFPRGTKGGDGWDGHTEYNIKLGTGEHTQAQHRADNITFLETGTPDDPVLAFLGNNWDNRPWVQPTKIWYVDRSASEFGANAASVKQWMNDPANRQKFFSNLLLINAWNEMGEGGYLLPSVSEGADHLKALRMALEGKSYNPISPVFPIGANSQAEAEALGKGSTYRVSGDVAASAGAVAKISAGEDQGAVWGSFSGASGTYTVKICYRDEKGGQSMSDLYIDGRMVASWKWDEETDAFAMKSIPGLSLRHGAIVKVTTHTQGSESAQIDHLAIHQ